MATCLKSPAPKLDPRCGGSGHELFSNQRHRHDGFGPHQARAIGCSDRGFAAQQQVAHLKQENDRLRRELKRLSDFLDTSSDVVCETNDRLAITASNADLQLPIDHIGLKLAEALGINPLSSRRWISHLESLAGPQPFRGFELSVRQSDESEVWLEINGNPTFARGRFQGYRGTCRNVTERKCYEAQIAFMANHDPLTRLANRTQFHELTANALVASGRHESIAVLCLDRKRRSQATALRA